jgi:hypothetical protein
LFLADPHFLYHAGISGELIAGHGAELLGRAAAHGEPPGASIANQELNVNPRQAGF